jgi:hypothetical protein
MSLADCQASCQVEAPPTWKCVDDGCAIDAETGEGRRFTRCEPCGPGERCPYLRKSDCEHECQTWASACGPGPRVPERSLSQAVMQTTSGVEMNAGYSRTNSGRDAGFGFRSSGGTKPKCACDTGFSWQKQGDHGCGCVSRPTHAGTRSGCGAEGTIASVVAASHVSHSRLEGAHLESAAPVSECGSDRCCCKPSKLCLDSKTSPTMVGRPTWTLGNKHFWSFDAVWQLNILGGGADDTNDMSLCQYEVWERSGDDLVPKFYHKWATREWNPTHSSHVSVPALIRAYERDQRMRCRQIKAGVEEGRTIVQRYPDTPSQSPVFIWDYRYVEIFIRVSSGCPGSPPCCMMLLITHHLGGQTVDARGPVCAQGCLGLPKMPSGGGHRPEFFSRIYENNIGLDWPVRGIGKTCNA